MAYCNKPVAYVKFLAHIQHVNLDMKNENKTASVLILIFPGKGSLVKTTWRNTL